MACNSCEIGFQGYQSLVVSITRVGTTAYLYLANQGRNILHIRRIILCQAGSTTLYLRPPPNAISWSGLEYLDTGTTYLYYTLTAVPATALVQAQAEYIEIEGRARSCVSP
jgi:hypothetical protein